MKGTYVLIISLPEAMEMTIGALGKIRFKEGYYAYIGSALNSLEKRTARHLSSEKKLHWHVDYLLQKAEILDVLKLEDERKLECFVAENLQEFDSVRKFGSSDCSCKSHLFFSEDISTLKKSAEEALAKA